MELPSLIETLDLTDGSISLKGAYQHEIVLVALRRVLGGTDLIEGLQAGLDYHDATTSGDNSTELETVFFGVSADRLFLHLMLGMELLLEDVDVDPLEHAAADEFMHTVAGSL